MKSKQPHFKTREVHAGVSPDPVTGAILTPIYQSTTYVQESVDKYLEKGYSYSRSGNPTVVALEKKLNDLEGGAGALCFATGMAATSCTMMALLNAGEHAVLSDVVYGGTHRLSTRVLSRFGVEYSFVDTSNPQNVRDAIKDNTRLIFTETPANPTLKLTDIAAVSAIAKEHKIPHVVDNTFLTPYYQRPLELGADIALHSTTKYMDGHNVRA
jgi:cystathionine beta-lyase/cystathionine gamma-synthase